MTRRSLLERAGAAAAAAALIGAGCGPVTVGQRRRRSLYGAMLWSWLLGLALAWRWWGRPRRPPSA